MDEQLTTTTSCTVSVWGEVENEAKAVLVNLPYCKLYSPLCLHKQPLVSRKPSQRPTKSTLKATWSTPALARGGWEQAQVFWTSNLHVRLCQNPSDALNLQSPASRNTEHKNHCQGLKATIQYSTVAWHERSLPFQKCQRVWHHLEPTKDIRTKLDKVYKHSPIMQRRG